MLARVLAMALCLSVTSRCSIEVVGRIELILRKFRVRVLSSETFFLNSGLGKFRHGISIERAVDLAREM